MSRIYILTQLMLIILLIQDSPGQVSPLPQNTRQWLNHIGGKSWDMSAGVVCDSKNNIFLAGCFYGTLSCNSEEILSYGNRDMFIARFDSEGSLKYMFSCGGKGYDMVSCVAVTDDDNIIIGGVISDTATFGSIVVPGCGRRPFIAAVSNNGKFIWVKSFTATGETLLSSISTDKPGNIFVTGVFSGKLTSDGKEVTSNGKKDIFLARLSRPGTVEKIFSFGSTDDDSPVSLSADIYGNVALAGAFNRPFKTGGPQLPDAPAGTKSNIFLAKFDKDFNVLQTGLISGDDFVKIASLKHDKSGNLYLAGSFNSKIQAADTILFSEGFTDIFIFKYRPDCKMEWGRGLGSWYYDNALHVNVDNLGGALISGSMGDKMTVDSLVIEPEAIDNSAFVMQFSPEGVAIWAACIPGDGKSFSSGSATDKQGNLCFAGSFRGNLGKGSDVVTSLGDQDIYLTKYFNCKGTEADISGQLSFCPGTGTVLGVKRGFSNIIWNDTISGKQNILAEKPGKYWVSMIDKKGCLLTDTVLITQNELPVFSLGKDTTLLVGDSLLLSAPVGFSLYQWNNYMTDREYLVRSFDGKAGTADYWLKVTDSLNCVYSDTISVTFLPGTRHDLPGKIQLVTYPNPARERIYWYLKTDVVCSLVLDLTDAGGRIIYHQVLDNYLSGEVKEVNIYNLSPGLYNLRVSNSASGKRYKTVRIIKQ